MSKTTLVYRGPLSGRVFATSEYVQSGDRITVLRKRDVTDELAQRWPQITGHLQRCETLPTGCCYARCECGWSARNFGRRSTRNEHAWNRALDEHAAHVRGLVQS